MVRMVLNALEVPHEFTGCRPRIVGLIDPNAVFNFCTRTVY
jgi:hypothetical protein